MNPYDTHVSVDNFYSMIQESKQFEYDSILELANKPSED